MPREKNDLSLVCVVMKSCTPSSKYLKPAAMTSDFMTIGAAGTERKPGGRGLNPGAHPALSD